MEVDKELFNPRRFKIAISIKKLRKVLIIYKKTSIHLSRSKTRICFFIEVLKKERLV